MAKYEVATLYLRQYVGKKLSLIFQSNCTVASVWAVDEFLKYIFKSSTWAGEMAQLLRAQAVLDDTDANAQHPHGY